MAGAVVNKIFIGLVMDVKHAVPGAEFIDLPQGRFRIHGPGRIVGEIVTTARVRG